MWLGSPVLLVGECACVWEREMCPGYLALLAGVVQVLGNCLGSPHGAKEIQAPGYAASVTSPVAWLFVSVLSACSLFWAPGSLYGLCWARNCHSPALVPQDGSV